MSIDQLSKLSLNTLAALALDQKSEAKAPMQPGEESRNAIQSLKDGPIPLSFTQERFWVMDKISPENPFFNIPFGVAISGTLDPKLMQEAWFGVIQRHETLRSVFILDGHTPQVRYLEAKQCALKIDKANSIPQDFTTELTEELNKVLYTGFFLDKGPLIRGKLLQHSSTSHSLLVVVHHSVFDGWSTSLFLDELFSRYAAAVQGRAASIPPLPTSYGQFAAWQREVISKDQNEVNWWKDYLKNLQDLDLPTDFARPKEQSFDGAAISFDLSKDLSEDLETMAHEAGATPYIVWLSIFALALAEFSGKANFAIGTPTSGRTHSQLEGLIGCFLNNLTLKIHLDSNQMFTDFLSQVRQSSFMVMDHAELPFQNIAAAMGSSLDLGKHPLFQVALTFQNTPMHHSVMEGLAIKPLDLPILSTHLDMELIVWPGEHGTRCTLIYATELFKPKNMQNFCNKVQNLVTAITTVPNQTVRQLLSAETMDPSKFPIDLSLSKGNAKTYPFTPPWELFSSLLAKKPDQTCLVIDDENEHKNISVKEFATEVENMAGALMAKGVRASCIVALALPQGMLQLASMLAVWKLGATWTPVDPNYPLPRVLHVLTESGATHLLSTPELHESLKLPDMFSSIIRVSTQERGKVTKAIRVSPSDTACILYTSGTTGKPKAIELSFGAISFRWNWMWATFPWKKNDCVCQKTSPLFVDFLWEAFGSILKGVKLVIPSTRIGADVKDMLEKIERHQITHIVLVPSLLRTLNRLTEGFSGRLQSLRIIVSSGEPFPPEMAATLLRAIPKLTILNLYGSTEVMDMTCMLVDRNNIEQILDAGEVPLGMALPESSVAILNDFLLPVKKGRRGIIYVTGPSLSKGYRNGANQNAFVNIRLNDSDRAPQNFFRMGDAGWMDDAGNIRYIGRNDQQVKIRGVRIEPEDVRLAILANDNVQEAVVAADHDSVGNQRLISHVQLEDNSPKKIRQLRQFLFDRLPATMVPDILIPVNIWPRTPSGKIDRRKLSSPNSFVPSHPTGPKNGTLAQVISEIWQAVIGIPTTDYQTTFFEAGGNSLLITLLHDALQKQFNREFPLTQLFEYPTIETQAKLFNVHHQPRNGEKEESDGPRSRANIRRAARRRITAPSD